MECTKSKYIYIKKIYIFWHEWIGQNISCMWMCCTFSMTIFWQQQKGKCIKESASTYINTRGRNFPLNAVNRLAISRELFHLCNWFHVPWYLWNLLLYKSYRSVDSQSKVLTLSPPSSSYFTLPIYLQLGYHPYNMCEGLSPKNLT